MSPKYHTTLLFSIDGSNEHEIDIEVEGFYLAGRPERGPSFECAGGYPAEPECIEDLCVGFYLDKMERVQKNWVDITNLLSKKQIEALEEKLILIANEGIKNGKQ